MLSNQMQKSKELCSAEPLALDFSLSERSPHPVTVSINLTQSFVAITPG